MKKINMRYVAVGSILSLGGFLLYKHHEMKLVKKNTEDYILNEFPNEEVPKRKYITLHKAKRNH